MRWRLTGKEILVADAEKLTRFLMLKNGGHTYIPGSRWNSQVGKKRSGFSNVHLNSGSSCTKEYNDVLQRDLKGSQKSDQQADDAEARNDFWSFAGCHFDRHHIEPGQTVCAK